MFLITLFGDQIHENGSAAIIPEIDTFIQQHESIYLTLCLDVFASAFAPGVSAPQPLGLTPWQVLPLLKHIAQQNKVISFDIAELSPRLDHNHMTTYLATSLLSEYIHCVASSENKH